MERGYNPWTYREKGSEREKYMKYVAQLFGLSPAALDLTKSELKKLVQNTVKAAFFEVDDFEKAFDKKLKLSKASQSVFLNTLKRFELLSGAFSNKLTFNSDPVMVRECLVSCVQQKNTLKRLVVLEGEQAGEEKKEALELIDSVFARCVKTPLHKPSFLMLFNSRLAKSFSSKAEFAVWLSKIFLETSLISTITLNSSIEEIRQKLITTNALFHLYKRNPKILVGGYKAKNMDA